MSELTLTCIDCTSEFPQPAGPWGARAKRCPDCRAAERRNRGNASSDGPMSVVAGVFATNNAEWHERLAGVALHHATGMPQDFATMIVEAVNVLLEQGETPGQIRGRLNPNPFGKLKAVDPRHASDRPVRSLEDTIREEFVG